MTTRLKVRLALLVRVRVPKGVLLGLVIATVAAGCLSSPVAEDGEEIEPTEARPSEEDPNASSERADDRRDDRTDEPAANRSAGPEEHSAEGGFSDTHVFPGNYSTSGNHSRVLEEGPHEALPYEVVNLTSTVDGTALRIGLLRPDLPEGTKAPVIVQASPYYHQPTPIYVGEPQRNGHQLEGDLRSHYYVDALVENFVSHGYAVALLPTRGTGGNGGCMDALSPGQGAEIDQASTWLGTRAWSSGDLAFIGLSQDGAAAWQAASLGNPHVSTIVPIAGLNDAFDLLFQNGTWGAMGPLFAPGQTTQGTLTYNPPPGPEASPAALASRATCENRWDGLVASAHATATGERDPWGYWAERNVRPGLLEDYDGSVLNVQGLQDPAVFPRHVYPWIQQLEAENVTVKHLLGQWGHTYPDWDADQGAGPNPTIRWDWAEILLHWFDHHLKGEESVDLGPRVQVADNQGRWRSADAWPPSEAEETPYYLTPEGSLQLSPSSETGTEPVGTNAAQIAGVEEEPSTTPIPCEGCAVFTTGPLDEPLRFAGAAWPHLTVTPTGPGGYLTAHLYALGPDGEGDLLTGGQLNLRFADGGEEAQPVVPGEPLTARMELNPTDAVVPADHELVLVVAQGSFGDDPTFGKLPTPAPMPVLLELGEGQSILTLQTFEADEQAFFEPPGSQAVDG